jgi:hypothetical protein
LAGFLQDNYNLLANADQFPDEPIGWDKAHFINELETNGLFSMHALNISYVKDWFIVLELAKTFPFIKNLEPNDQVTNFLQIKASTSNHCFYIEKSKKLRLQKKRSFWMYYCNIKKVDTNWANKQNDKVIHRFAI